MKNKVFPVIAAFLLLSLSTGAQSLERTVVSSAGSELSTSTIRLEYTVGEPAVGSFSQGTIALNQGFNQGYAKSSGSVLRISSGSIKVFPNPAVDQVMIHSDVKGVFEVFDYKGQRVAEGKLLAGFELAMSVNDWSSGLYTISLITDSGTKLNTKFVKP